MEQEMKGSQEEINTWDYWQGKVSFFTVGSLFLVVVYLLFSMNACQRTPPPLFRLLEGLEQRTTRIISEENWQEIYRDFMRNQEQNLIYQNILSGGRGTFYLKGKTFEGLLAPPDSLCAFELDLGKKCVFDFGFGLFRNAQIIQKNSALQVMFSVSIKTPKMEAPKQLFSQMVPIPRRLSDHQVFFHRLNLAPYRGNRVTIILETKKVAEGEKEDTAEFIPAFWINPLVYSPRKPGDPAASRPNIILISIDTLRADHLGCYGYFRPTSPTIDELASQGIIFTRTFSHSPYTLASHMSILTGLYPLRHRVLYLNQSLDPSVSTIADYFRKGGYICGAITDGGQVSHRFGFAQGFDFFEESYWANIRPDSAEYIFEKSSIWLRRHRDAQFFLFIHTYQPHNPYHAPAPWGEMFLEENFPLKKASLQQILGKGYPHLFQDFSETIRQNLIALYDGEIRYTDEKLVKQLVSLLHELKLDRMTAIIITSDHGEEFFDHSSWGHGHQLYNEILHVPLIIKLPGSQMRSRRIDYPVRLVDVLPTLLEIAGIEPPEEGIDGHSLLPLLNSTPREEFASLAYLPDEFAAFIPRGMALFKGEKKFIWWASFSPEAREFFQPPPQEVPLALFDLSQDLQERNNLAAKEVSLCREFFHQVEKLLEEAIRAEKAGRSSEALNKALRDRLHALGYIK